MSSIFYDELNRRFPVPLLAIEYYGSMAAAAGTQEGRSAVFSETLIRICRVRTPTDADREYLLHRLNELEQPKELSEGKPHKTFGSSFNEYLRKSDTSQLLGLMTNYDVAKMRVLYCEVDHVDTKRLISNFVAYQIEQNVVAYEAQLYGSGGSYKGDKGSSSGNVKEWDLNSQSGEAALAQFGIGTLSSGALKDLGVNLDG